MKIITLHIVIIRETIFVMEMEIKSVGKASADLISGCQINAVYI
ncbi:hypothetical protein RB153_16940 [Paenibacillus larvae]|nr:hypothetical protein [Paenibacillus larvae]MDR5568627.1 hypothetical protein [Paenibacillus larvae]MDR5597099.1 hypothetical protein [Paenibacillus larvae]